MEMEGITYQEGMINPYAALFESFPALQTIDMHVRDRHVQLRKGIESGIEELEVEPRPDEWKEQAWIT